MIVNSDEAQLKAIVTELVAKNSDKIEVIRKGKIGIFGWFVAQVMKSTNGQAKPDLVARLLREEMKLPPPPAK